LIPTHCI